MEAQSTGLVESPTWMSGWSKSLWKDDRWSFQEIDALLTIISGKELHVLRFILPRLCQAPECLGPWGI